VLRLDAWFTTEFQDENPLVASAKPPKRTTAAAPLAMVIRRFLLSFIITPFKVKHP